MKRSLPLPLLLLCLASGPALAQKSKPVPAGCKEDFGDCREECSMDYGGSTRTYKQLTACIAECGEKRDVCRDRHYTALGSGLDPGALERPRAADPAMREPSRTSTRDDLRDDVEEERPSRPAEKERPARASREETPAPANDEAEVESEPVPARRDVYRAPQPAPKKAVAPPAAEPAPAYDDSVEEAGSLPPPPPKAEVKPAAMREPAPETKPAALVRESDPQEDAEPLPPPPPPKPKVEEPRPAPVVRPPPPPEPKKKDISEWDPNADE